MAFEAKLTPLAQQGATMGSPAIATAAPAKVAQSQSVLKVPVAASPADTAKNHSQLGNQDPGDSDGGPDTPETKTASHPNSKSTLDTSVQVPSQQQLTTTKNAPTNSDGLAVAAARPNTIAPVVTAADAPSQPAPASTETANAPLTTSIDTRPTEAAIPAASAGPKTEPVRDLSLRIGDSATNQVEVKIQERSGEVRVAVSSNSPELSTDLRQQVGDLVGRLDRAGYHTETLKPTSAGALAGSRSESEPGQPQDSSGRQQQQNQQQNQGRPRKGTQPQWLQEMNGNLGTTPTEGVSNQ